MREPMEWIIFLIIVVSFYLLVNTKKKKFLMKDDFESELMNFKISTKNETNSAQQSNNQNIGSWIHPNTTVTVGNMDITKGYIYFGGRLNSLDNGCTEASLLDPTLPVNMESPDYNGQQINYWPSYYSLSPESRSAYIEWLAGDRNNPKDYIGYVFLYFYGIERRILVDNKNGLVSEYEYIYLVKEVERLLEIYRHNKSFNSYVINFLSFIWATNNGSSRFSVDR